MQSTVPEIYPSFYVYKKYVHQNSSLDFAGTTTAQNVTNYNLTIEKFNDAFDNLEIIIVLCICSLVLPPNTASHTHYFAKSKNFCLTFFLSNF